MPDSYSIIGGKSLRGKIRLSGAKNVALKTIIAALMFESKVVLDNIPKINDVLELLNLIKHLGASAKFIDKNKVEIDGRTINQNKVDLVYGSKIRVSFMLFAPLLYKFGECFVPNPGGCRIGARPIDRIIKGMKALGISVTYNSKTGYYKAKLTNKPKGIYTFEKPSHTGTELLMLIGLLTHEEVVIENPATEPEIDDLILFLNLSGANIQKENNKIIVKKNKKLFQNKPFSIISDRNEFVTYATLAVASCGEVIIGPIDENLVSSFLSKANLANVGVEKLKDNHFRFYFKGKINPIDIDTTPHPGFMTDWQPSWAILMLQAEGTSSINERVFENRFAYVTQLKKLGARIEFADDKVENPKDFYFFNYKTNKSYNQKIKIEGGAILHNAILEINDLRAGAALACAALLVPGETIVNGVSILERGYEDFEGKIKSLGGEIKKI